MKIFVWMLCGVSMCAWLGCGGTPATNSNSAAEDRSAQPIAAASPAVESEPKPDYSVTADSYSGIDQAIAALSVAAKEEDTVEIVRADKWLVMQGGAAIEPLAAILNDDEADLAARIAACRTLRQLGPGAKDALQEAVGSDTQQIQLNAIKGLSAIRPTDPQIIATLVGLMEHPELRLRQEAILGLENIGPAAQDAAEEKLIALLNDPDANQLLRDCAKRALKEVAPRRKFTD